MKSLKVPDDFFLLNGFLTYKVPVVEEDKELAPLGISSSVDMPQEMKDPFQWARCIKRCSSFASEHHICHCEHDVGICICEGIPQSGITIIETALKMFDDKFRPLTKEERRQESCSNHSDIDADAEDTDDEDTSYDPSFDEEQPTNYDYNLYRSDLIGREERDDDLSDTENDLEDIKSGIDYLLDESNGVNPNRLHAERYVEILIKNILRDDSRFRKVSKSKLIKMLKLPCELCGRVHLPGINAVNSIDRLFSFIRLCKYYVADALLYYL